MTKIRGIAKKTALQLSTVKNRESIIEAVKFVSDNNDLLSANARTKYENKFSLKSWSAGWKKVLDDKESEFNT